MARCGLLLGCLLALIAALAGCGLSPPPTPVAQPPTSLPPTAATATSLVATPVPASTTAATAPPTSTDVPSSTSVPATIAPTDTLPPATATIAPPTLVPATATSAPAPGPLAPSQVAATAIANAAGEECVSAPPQPAKGFIGNPTRGKALFSDRGCSACHGDLAQGNIGPKLAGTTLPFSAVIQQLRSPRGTMQRYLPADQSDADECDVYSYVKSLK
jgi:mono/diheme cytochrome c family protein